MQVVYKISLTVLKKFYSISVISEDQLKSFVSPYLRRRHFVGHRNDFRLNVGSRSRNVSAIGRRTVPPGSPTYPRVPLLKQKGSATSPRQTASGIVRPARRVDGSCKKVHFGPGPTYLGMGGGLVRPVRLGPFVRFSVSFAKVEKQNAVEQTEDSAEA